MSVSRPQIDVNLRTDLSPGGRPILDAILVPDFINVKRDEGAAADGVTDDLTALNSAFSQAGKAVFLPAGTYYYTANLTPPLCAYIFGAGIGATILKPGPGVTKGLSLCTGGPVLLQNLELDGSLTTNAKGLVLGDSAVAGTDWGTAAINNVSVHDFGGGSGVGVRVADAVSVDIVNLSAQSNDINVLVQGLSAGFPSTVTFKRARFEGATTKNVKILGSFKVSFISSIIESSGEEGVYIDGNNGSTSDCLFLDCWFEDNYGSHTTQYQFKSTGTVHAIRFTLRDCFFNGDPGTAKSINVDGSANNGFAIDNVHVTAGVTSGILIQNSAKGTINNYPTHLTYSTEVHDSGGEVHGPYGTWLPFTPVYASDLGNAAATFVGGAGGVTTSVARYKVIGKTIFIQLAYSATLLAVTPTYIEVQIPNGTVDENNYFICELGNNGVEAAGKAVARSNGTIRFYRLPTALYTSGGAVYGNLTACFEIAA